MQGIIHEPLRSAIGGEDPVRWLKGLPSEAVRHKAGRLTIRFGHGGRTYFAKISDGLGLREAAKELLSLRTPPLDAGREAQALEHLASRGVPVPKLVAWGTKGPWPLGRRSFLITEDVGTQKTAGDVLRDLRPHDFRGRRSLVRSVGQLAGDLHRAGVNHRDLYLGHLLAQGEDPPHSLVLIDLHRAQRWRSIPERWLAKDLGCLAFDVHGTQVTRTDRMRFIRAYSGKPVAASVIRSRPSLWARAMRRVDRLREERARKGSAFGG